MMRIHTVAAGGGSILHFDGARFRVGPDSAGANPGPACYRRGGPLDGHRRQRDARQARAGVLPGDLRPGRRPAARRRRRARASSRRWPPRSRRDRHRASPEEVADGFLQIAVENMANAIKKISVQRGYDVTEYALQLLRRRRRPARLPGRRRAGHDARAASTRSPACCRPTAWASPTSARCAQRAVEARLDDAALAAVAADVRARSRPTARAEVAAQGVAAARDRRASHAARICATTAPTRALDGAARRRATRCVARLRGARTGSSFGFLDAGASALVIEAVAVEAVGGGATAAEQAPPSARRAAAAGAARATRIFTGGRVARRAGVTTATTLRAGRRDRRPGAHHRAATRPSVVEPGWQARAHRARPPRAASASRRARARARRSAPTPTR